MQKMRLLERSHRVFFLSKSLFIYCKVLYDVANNLYSKEIYSSRLYFYVIRGFPTHSYWKKYTFIHIVPQLDCSLVKIKKKNLITKGENF